MVTLEEEQKYYEENFVQIMLDKIDKKVLLSEEEIERIIFDYSIDSEDIDESRWSMYTHSIVKLNNRTFRVEWERGLTECQDNYFNSQLPVEVEEVERVIKVKVWQPIK